MSEPSGSKQTLDLSALLGEKIEQERLGPSLLSSAYVLLERIQSLQCPCSSTEIVGHSSEREEEQTVMNPLRE